MVLTGDYHTHTVYSHGKNTIEENVLSAIDKNLKTIGITDHGPGHVFYGVRENKLLEMKENIKKLNKKYDNIEILFGVEANFLDFDGNIDLSQEIIEELDYIAVGFHSGIIPRGNKAKLLFSSFGNLLKINKKAKEKLKDLAAETMIKATYKYNIKFITHPASKFGVNIDKLINNMNPKTMLEINNKHDDLKVEDLIKIKSSNIKVIVNSDAHNRNDVGKVDKSLKLLKESNFPLDQIYNIEI